MAIEDCDWCFLWSPGNPATMTLFVREPKDCLGVTSIVAGLPRIAMACLDFATSSLVPYILLLILPHELYGDCNTIWYCTKIIRIVSRLLP